MSFHLQGNFAPVSTELEVDALHVEGEVPRALNGWYLRNGPNPKESTAHWFMGQGMLHGVQLRDGRALTYRNRWIANVARGGPANTHVIRHGQRCLALAEGHLPIVIGDDLETLHAFDFGGAMGATMTAHARTCPLTGELLFFGYQRQPPFLTYYQADRSGNLSHRTPIEVAAPTYMHDFAITEHFVLFLDLPVMLRGSWSEPGPPIAWSEEYGARIGILPRMGKGKDIRWFPIAPCHVGHVINAFEDGPQVVLDVVRAERLGAPTHTHRFAIDLDSSSVSEVRGDRRFVEFPRIDARREGLPYRFAYAVELRDVDAMGAPQRSVLCKLDLATGGCKESDFGSSQMPGEGVFVAEHPGAEEDEGFLLSFVYDRERDTSFLAILSAQDLTVRARIHLPRRVPFGFHGNWFPECDR